MSIRPIDEKRGAQGSWVLLGALALVAGCSTQGDVEFGPMPHDPAPAPEVADEPYRIQAGDEIEIRFFHTPELDVSMPVRPDGFVSLPLVHELEVADRTVEELRQELFERYSVELADPELAVIVRTFHTYPVHVGGEVGKPGVLELQGNQGALEAVLAAGGFLVTADLAEVRVARRLDEGGYKLIKADVRAFLEGRRADGNVILRPYDVVYVPRSEISEVNKWVDQYIRKNIPIDFTYRLDVGDTN